MAWRKIFDIVFIFISLVSEAGVVARAFWSGRLGRPPPVERARHFIVIARAAPAIAKTHIASDVSEVHRAYALRVSRARRVPRAHIAALCAAPCRMPLHCKPLRCIFHVRVDSADAGPVTTPRGQPKHFRDIVPDMRRQINFRRIASYRFQGR